MSNRLNMIDNLHSLMNSFSITGNLYVDGLIATTAFGMMKGWLDIIVEVLKTILEFVYVRLRYYVFGKLSSKLGGRELYEVEYSAPCEIYYFLKKYVLTEKGDDLSQQFKQLYIKNFFDPHSWYNHNTNVATKGKLEVDYLGKTTIHSRNQKNALSSNKLYFRYKYKGHEYIIQFWEYDEDYYKSYYMDGEYSTYRYGVKKPEPTADKNGKNTEVAKNEPLATTINMEMVSFSSDYVPTLSERQIIVESFLNEKFNMQALLYRTYKISLSTAIGEQLHTAVGKSNILRVNSISIDHTDQKVLNRFIEGVSVNVSSVDDDNMSSIANMQLNVKQLQFGFKYQDQIKLANRSNQRSVDSAYSLVDRFIQKNPQLGYREIMMTYEDNLVYFMSDSEYILYIVTQGKKLSQTNVKNILQWLIEISFSVTKSTVTKNQVSVYKRQGGDWNNYILSMRTFGSIYLPKVLMNTIRNEFDGFIEIEKLYREYQIPYKKGILFYGPPGTGKTSLVKALAYEYQLPLYIIDVNDEEINDESIVSILNGLGNNGLKLLLFEDIDTAFADKEKVKNEAKILLQQTDKSTSQQNGTANTTTSELNMRKKFLTYSGLLNALDGVMSNQSGVITIMTTNYIERLGAAFLRPGRIDVKFELTECNAEQIEEMTRSFLLKRLDMSNKFFVTNESEKAYTQDEIDSLIQKFVKHLADENGKSKVKPCELQFYLLRYIRNIQDIFDKYYELLNTENPELNDVQFELQGTTTTSELQTKVLLKSQESTESIDPSTVSGDTPKTITVNSPA